MEATQVLGKYKVNSYLVGTSEKFSSECCLEAALRGRMAGVS